MGETKPTASLSSGLLARKGGASPAMRRPNAANADGGIEEGQDDLGWNDMGYDVNPEPNAPTDNKGRINPLAAAVPEATPEVKKQQDRIAAQLNTQHASNYPTEAIGVPRHPSPLVIGGIWTDENTQQDEAEEDEEYRDTHDEVVEDVTSADVAAEPAEPAETTPENTAENTAQIVATSSQREIVAQLAAVQRQEPVAEPKKRAAPGSKAKAAFTLRLDKERHLKLRLATAVSNKSAQRLVTEALDKMLEEMPEVKALSANLNTNT